jgi:hypothetical protein
MNDPHGGETPALISFGRRTTLAPWRLEHWIVLAAVSAFGACVSLFACVYAGLGVSVRSVNQASACGQFGQPLDEGSKDLIRVLVAVIATVPFVAAASLRPRGRLAVAALVCASPALFSLYAGYASEEYFEPFCF